MNGIFPEDSITGIRVESWPSPLGLAGDAVLSELRMDWSPMGTTNIALGCPVSVSDSLPTNEYAECLTDGLAGSYAYAETYKSGQEFYFQVDLLHGCKLDHVCLRSAAQSGIMSNFADLRLQLFDEEPSSDTEPIWEGKVREASPVQDPGGAYVVRSGDGQGTFQGRYLRIICPGGTHTTVRIAEVEAYESITAPGARVYANDQWVAGVKKLQVPADANWLGFDILRPPLPDNMQHGIRWRIAGAWDEWQPANWGKRIETRGLQPGEYSFEVELRHTDHVWNEATLKLPFTVLMPWWKKPWAMWAGAAALAGLAALLSWGIAQRRVAELERRQELSRERARIARDMHDVVGARLTQLAMMQDIFAAEHPQSENAGEQLQRLSGAAREAVAALDEAVWAVNPRNDTLQNVAEYLCGTAEEYLAPLKIACRQDVPVEWPAIDVVSKKRHELLLAFKETLQNIAKHSGASQVMLTLRHESGRFLVRIEDNGRGLPAELEGVERDGVGNMAARLASIGGNCVVRSRPEGGTLVEFQMPV